MIDYRQPARLLAMEQRLRNYTMCRERDDMWIPWLRPDETRHLGLTAKRPLCLVNGAFDVLTSSHMRLIFAARHKAATLVCALDSDAKVAAAKGHERPIQSWIERAVTLNYMPLDALVQIEDRADMDEVMLGLRPDFRVQGMEYSDHASRYPKIPRVLVRLGTMRTSEIVERIRARYNAKTKP